MFELIGLIAMGGLVVTALCVMSICISNKAIFDPLNDVEDDSYSEDGAL